jgi:hypothetical protein
MPRGRRAVAAWRALSAQARQDAFETTRRGVAPSDVGVAWAAAGYGWTVARRMRVGWFFVPVAVMAVMVPVGAGLVAARASALTVDVVMAVLLVAVLGGFVGLSVWARRYQRLHACGLLGMEAARLGSLAPTPGQSVWGASADSGFTVPYHAQVPIPEPVARPVPDPVAAGVREIPLRRGRVLGSLAALVALGLVLWLMAIVLWIGVRPPVFSTVVTVLAALYTLVLALFLYVAVPAVRRPVTARFTPDGWELPAQRMSGAWAQVRAIRVRPLSTGGVSAGSPQLAAVRVVTLIVDDPEQCVAHLSTLRRKLLQASIKKYGSPVAIVATPKRTMPFVELVQLLQHYTSAPVEWAPARGSATTSGPVTAN